jgi:hypothetical protein
LTLGTGSYDGTFGEQTSLRCKNVDRFRGKKAEDTGITSVFLGPRLVASRGRFSAEVAAEIRFSSTTRHCKSCPITACAPQFRSTFSR